MSARWPRGLAMPTAHPLVQTSQGRWPRSLAALASAALLMVAMTVAAPAHAWRENVQDTAIGAPAGVDIGVLPVGGADHADADGAGDPNQRQLLVMLRLPATHYRPDATYGGRYMDDNGNGARRRRAEALARQHGLTVVEGWAMSLLGIDCYVMQYGDHADPQLLIEQLSRDPQVEWAQSVARFDGMAQVPDSAAADAADALYQVQPAARYWHVADLHRYATGREVRVAVIDSGIDGEHPDLAGQLAVNTNFVDAGPPPPELHGTAVAGIIAARSGNGGIVGVAPRAKLMGLRACWQTNNARTRCNSFTLSKALNYAILNNAKIINLSLSGPPDKLLDRLLDVALERGISVVGAVDPQDSGPAFPASHRGVMAVASQPRPGMAPSTKNSATTGLLAPGNDIPTTSPGARWAFVNGSSYAAAHVSGMLALLEELRPDASPTQLRTMLQPADMVKTANIDACATISRLIRQCSCTCPVPATATATATRPAPVP
ncbi:subtilisin family serine protease [Duganella sp. 3397]|uniref:S8 family peptidase n=1 Tax=Duganella sp. 3397 TaxID=2817732 RepID=UPI002865AAC7|nr:S8 family serine peptidase [Duganella sp. 3397]MDR7048591.1 subtilisin family serine protease [Duganella sp. 3397]